MAPSKLVQLPIKRLSMVCAPLKTRDLLNPVRINKALHQYGLAILYEQGDLNLRFGPRKHGQIAIKLFDLLAQIPTCALQTRSAPRPATQIGLQELQGLFSYHRP